MPRLRKKGRFYLGVDPGVKGGLAAIDRTGKVDGAVRMPPTEKDIYQWFALYQNSLDVAVIESINPGIPGYGKGSVAKLYGSYMSLRMALVARHIRFESVTTAKAMRLLGIPPRKKSEERGDWKNRLKARAQELFPNEDITLYTSDALLFAEYCRRVNE